ncbi:UNVERIFIED_CONTAM: putative spermidine/putrescine transport system ATP-binding protein [Brevibacillus sp. OAP136]
MGNSLEIVQASKYYKNFKAVDNISLSVKQGEFLTILGPSGSGKTSLLKLIAGFEGLTSGSILLNGRDITMQKPYERNIGMLFQNYALFPHMTVEQNIAYPLKLRKLAKTEIMERVARILKIVHLEGFNSRYPRELSGGQQQRVALARAVVFNPPILLLDEPLGALDKNLRQKMQLEIKQIQVKLGITTISVTHDQEEALTMSDRVCVMDHGRIEQIATPEYLYKYPANRFVAEFIGEINLLHGMVDREQNGTPLFRLRNGKTVTLSDGQSPQTDRHATLLAIRPENLRIAEGDHSFANTLSAKVRELIYLGEAVKVKATTETGEELTVKIPSYQSHLIHVGKETILGWEPSEASLLTEEKAEPAHKPVTLYA